MVQFSHLNSVHLVSGKLVSLDLSVDSMFIGFFLISHVTQSTDAYPFVFLNPLELKAIPAKERIVFFEICKWHVSLGSHMPLACQQFCL